MRTTELVKGFSNLGHHVSLVTKLVSEYHQSMMDDFGFRIIDLGKIILPKIDLDHIRGLNLLSRGLRRALNIAIAYPEIELMFKTKRILSGLKGFDLLITVAAPHTIHWGAAWARNKENRIAKTWVADCGDPFMLNSIDSFKKMFYFEYFERFWCSKADFVTIPRMDMKINYYKEYHEKIREIPQGLDFEFVSRFIKPYRGNSVPTFAFAGSFIRDKRDPRRFLKYLLSKDIDFRFHIYSRTKGIVEPLVARSQGRIVLHNYVSRDDLFEILSQMDFLVNISYDVKTQLPSKLIEYYLMKRPILNLKGDKLDTKKIDRFLVGDYTGQMRRPDVEQYKIDNVCHKFLALTMN